MAEQPTTPQTDEIVAIHATEWRVRRFIMVLVLVGYGIYSLYDGYIRYPKENEAALIVAPNGKPPRSRLDIGFNQVIGWVLPPLGLVLMAFTLYSSRGEYRLKGNVLNVPGHRPISLDSIREIDKNKWDRKGIARLTYEFPNGKKGRFTLDDYIYQRKPTDDILERIEKYVGIESEPESKPQTVAKPPAAGRPTKST